MSQDWFKVICTVGPSSRNPKVLKRMEGLGISAFRINLSHTPIDDVAPFIREIREATDVPICLDTEGAQIRTGRMPDRGITLRIGEEVRLVSEQVMGEEAQFTLSPPEAFTALEPGTMLNVDFDACLLMVVAREANACIARVMCSGRVGGNKGVAANPDVALPPMTEKDFQAVAIARDLDVNLFSFSFASSGSAVRALRECAGPGAVILSKIESRLSLLHLNEIIEESDGILIDRGDLSRSAPLEEIPALQKLIIRRAHQKPIPVYVATNLLESMVSLPYPTRAEVNDIANSLYDGANGLVLAAETAIGKYPVKCASMVMRLIQQHREEMGSSLTRLGLAGRSGAPSLAASPPQGGRLVIRDKSERPSDEILELPRLVIRPASVRELEKIALGCYSPIEGFMNRKEVDSVLNRFKLPDGTAWPSPVVLPVDPRQVEGYLNQTLVLQCSCCQTAVGLLEVSDIFRLDLKEVAQRWFGSVDPGHPGGAEIHRTDGGLMGGRVRLLKAHSDPLPADLHLFPVTAREIFAHRGWDRVVGCCWDPSSQRMTESLLQNWLEMSQADGLFIQIPCRAEEDGAYSSEDALRKARSLLESPSLQDRTLTSITFSSPLHLGPRGMALRALVHRNYGCSQTVISDDDGDDEAEEVTELWTRVRAFLDEGGATGMRPLYFSDGDYPSRSSSHRSLIR